MLPKLTIITKNASNKSCSELNFLKKKLMGAYLISDKKGYIHFWCKMTPYRSHSDPSAV